MRTLIDFDNAPIFAIPVSDGFRGLRLLEGMLIEGPQGWGEFSPPADCGDPETVRRLTAAIEAGTVGWPDPVRGRVPVTVAVPAVDPTRAREITAAAGCRTAEVQVDGHPHSLADDIARLEAVRDALGPDGAIRCDANGRWDVDTAVAAIAALDRAAGGLEYVEQPCRTVGELAAVRRRVDVRIAADESIRQSAEPLRLELSEAADVAVLTVGPLGGVRRALRVAESCGLPCVVSATVETSIGLTGGLALAGVLPEVSFACGLGTAWALAGDLVTQGRSLIPVDGYLPVAPMPPAPDPGLVRRFAITDAQRVAYWRERLRAVHTDL